MRTRLWSSASRNSGWRSIGSAPRTSAFACRTSRRRLNILVGGQNVSTFDVGDDQYDVIASRERTVPQRASKG